MNHIVDFEVQNCISCGFVFGAPRSFFNRRRKDGREFYCPACRNAMYWKQGKSSEQKQIEQLRADLDRATRVIYAKDEALRESDACCRAATRQAAGYKGYARKLANKVKGKKR